jgi:hypothetical protein
MDNWMKMKFDEEISQGSSLGVHHWKQILFEVAA